MTTDDLSAYATDPVRFVDTFIRLNERGEPWTLSPYQRQVLALAFRWTADGYLDGLRYLLWSEPKKSGKTLLAAVLVAWWLLPLPH